MWYITTSQEIQVIAQVFSLSALKKGHCAVLWPGMIHLLLYLSSQKQNDPNVCSFVWFLISDWPKSLDTWSFLISLKCSLEEIFGIRSLIFFLKIVFLVFFALSRTWKGTRCFWRFCSVIVVTHHSGFQANNPAALFIFLAKQNLGGGERGCWEQSLCDYSLRD